MAFHHVVMFRWAESVDADHVARVAAFLDRLPQEIPEIARYRHGPDAGVNEGNYDYAVAGEFADLDAYLVYRDHPVHQEMIRTLIAGHIEGRAAVQFAT